MRRTVVIDANRIFSELIAANHRLRQTFVDENDVAYVALTLEVGGDLWTSDRELEAGLRRKGFTRFFTPGQRE